MKSSLENWIKKEFANIHFGDIRLKKRFFKVALALGQKSEKNICSSFDNWGDLKAAYRFLDNSKVNSSSILLPHQDNTVGRIREHKRVLFLQDTVYFTYENDRISTTGLDVCCKHFSGKKVINGLMMHGALAVSEDGIPLGLIEQKFIKRSKFRGGLAERSKLYSKLPIKKKESQRWIDFINSSRERDYGDTKIIHIADREGDI